MIYHSRTVSRVGSLYVLNNNAPRNNRQPNNKSQSTNLHYLYGVSQDHYSPSRYKMASIFSAGFFSPLQSRIRHVNFIHLHAQHAKMQRAEHREMLHHITEENENEAGMQSIIQITHPGGQFVEVMGREVEANSSETHITQEQRQQEVSINLSSKATRGYLLTTIELQ